MRARALLLLAFLSIARPAAALVDFVASYVDGVGGFANLNEPQDVVVSPDGASAYAVSEGAAAIVQFTRDTTSGALGYVTALVNGTGGVTGLGFASAVAISPDGKHVYVASAAATGAVAVFARDLGSGALSFVEAQSGVNLAVAEGVTVSPDGKHVYVTSFSNGSVVTYSRNVTTGALTFVEEDVDGVNGVDGLGYAHIPVVSPDGKHVYVAGEADDAIAVFSRNATSGALTFAGLAQNGVGGVTGLDAPYSVAISPDGKHVYSAGADVNALVGFSRDATTGALAFVQSLQDGVGGVGGLVFGLDVAVTPDGAHVLVAAAGSGEVGVFSRDAGSGMLTFVETVSASGLGGVNSVRLSPDGLFLYTTARSANAVDVFSIQSTTTTTVSTTTSTTTIVTSCPGIPVGATLASIACRLTLLRDATAAASALGPLQTKLDGLLAKAGERTDQAVGFCTSGDRKQAKARLKPVVRALGRYAHRVRSHKAATLAPAEIRDPLVAEADAIKADAKSLRRSGPCLADAQRF